MPGRRRRSPSPRRFLVTGALHEDGLADTADGFGGGDTRERKLEIMRDSRIGTYGVCALIVSLLVRADAIASLTDPVLVAPALIAAHAGARAVMPLVMFLLPAARTDGLRSRRGGLRARGSRSPLRSDSWRCCSASGLRMR